MIMMKNFTSRRMNKIINAKHFDSYAAITSGTEMCCLPKYSRIWQKGGLNRDSD